MATVQELELAIQEERDEVGRRVNALVAEVERLKEQVGTGTVLMPSDFDHLITQVRGIHTPPAE